MRKQLWVNTRFGRYQIGYGQIMASADRPHIQRRELGTCYRLIGRWGVIILRWPGGAR